LLDDFERPIGIAFSPDEKTLYVDDANRGAGGCLCIRAFDVRADGTLGNGRPFAALQSQTKGYAFPNAMKVDVEGNVYCVGPGAVEVFDPHGKPLGMIKMPDPSRKIAWGDADGKGLFVTTGAILYRIRLNIPGLRP
jgi:gluconolactonase